MKKKGEKFYEENMLQLRLTEKEKDKAGTCICQIVRSASQWSLGLNEEDNILENSIQNAYIELIHQSKYFIYIENQFFISSTAGEPVNNEIARALLLRILKAHKRKEPFRIVIFLPLLPGFAGDIDDPKSTILRIQVYWQLQTIALGENSLFKELKKQGITPEDYIQFFSLRQHAKLYGVPVTEIVYIHSKLMIVDDSIAILGSANINDRSMQGSRDSEIAVRKHKI
jgi:phospholipase D1/2